MSTFSVPCGLLLRQSCLAKDLYRNGGDTEVDVNDVSHKLNKVIPARLAEDTWQIDNFDGTVAANRPPDEVFSFYISCISISDPFVGNHSVLGFIAVHE